jgi:hypothetical protein
MVSIRRLTVASVCWIGLLGMTLASGCSEGFRRPTDQEAARVLARAGDLIGKARYVDAVVEYRERRGDKEAIVQIFMLFGPGKRIRVEKVGDFAFYDGARIGRLNPQTGESGTMEAPGKYVSPIMVVGTIMGGVTLPAPAARELGRKWWEHLYGGDALLQLLDPEIVNGHECYVVAVQPQGQSAHVVWHIAKDTYSFVSFEVVGSNPAEPPHGIIAAEYKSLRFPPQIEDERFSAPEPRAPARADQKHH